MIDRIMSNPDSCDDGILVNDLLREFHRGYPIEKLRPLMLSDNEKVAKVGIWVASELGGKAAPLLDDLTKLLHHPERYVRYFAIDSLLTCATREKEAAIAAVVSMLDDTDGAVRWKALDFLSRASAEQLEAGLSCLSKTEPDSLHLVGLRRLLGGDAGSPNEALSLLGSDSSTLRKYGVVAAVRMAEVTQEPLAVASSIDDEDVSGFAKDALKRIIRRTDRAQP